MGNPKDYVILGLLVAAIIGAFFYLDVENSLFGNVVEQFTPVNFDEVIPRNIVKNAIPITLLDENNDVCTVYAEKFFQITNHTYFVNSQTLSEKLQYDHDKRTLMLPCDQIPAEKSRLDVWYVIPESDKHSGKFEYWITPWTDTVMPGN